MIGYNLKQEKGYKIIHFSILCIIWGTAVLGFQLNESFPNHMHATLLIFIMPIVLLIMCVPMLKLKIGKDSSIITLILFFLLFLWSTVTGIWSEYTELSFRRSLLIYTPTLVFLLLLYSDKYPELTFWRVAKGLVLLGTFLSLIGLFLYVFGDDYTTHQGRIQSFSVGPFKISQQVYGVDYQSRISSLTGNPNSLAMWLMITLVFTVALRMLNKISKLLFFPVLGFQTVTLLLTASRTGIGATIVSLMLMYFISSPNIIKKMRNILIFILGTFSCIIIIFLSTDIRDGFDRGAKSVFTGRELAWQYGIEALDDNALVGVGFNTVFETVLEPHNIDLTLHNAHLTILLETGIIGFSIFICLWLFAIFSSLSNVNKSKKYASKELLIMYSIAFSILVGLFVHQLFETKIPRSGFFTLIWLYLLWISTMPYCKINLLSKKA